MLRAALEFLRPDRAYVLPAHHAPLKTAASASAAERLEMCRLALREALPAKLRRRVSVSSFEALRHKTTYTCETLAHFAGLHPGAALHLLIGSDSLERFHRWRRPAEVLSLSRLAVGRRPGHTAQTDWKLRSHVDWLPGLFPDISSTEIRAQLMAGKDVAPLLAKTVFRRVLSSGLYGVPLHRWLTRVLRPKRRVHSIAVAKMALKLARRHGLDIEKAALAGLLHDCGRIRVDRPRSRFLRHGHLGSEIARRDLGVRDAEVLDAIRNHVLGDPRMGELARLVYVADTCSADRRFPEAAAIRRAALRSLDKGLKAAVQVKLQYVLADEKRLHPAGVALWNSIVDRR